MQIRSLFAKDLRRPINGVVKADQLDEAVVWQELDEYVVTSELDRHFRNFFGAYASSLGNADDAAHTSGTGVWISGYFGSGKSHFLKILSYLLQNRTVTGPETGERRCALDFFREKIRDPELMANVERSATAEADIILFNIDSKANINHDEQRAILQVFWQVFAEMRGFYGEAPHIAAMEEFLTREGKFQVFQEKFLELSGFNWLEARDAWAFHRDFIIEALAFTTGMSQESATLWYEDGGKSQSLSVERFAEGVADYIAKSGWKRRVVFLVDEVGQFIGSDERRMLQLQTIVENLGTMCHGRAWVVVTSQSDIDTILGEVRASRMNDFSKIQGRFRTRLSLSSSNTDEVIQYRLLRKKSEAADELAATYKKFGDSINNQLTFSDSATLNTFSSEESFVKSYPFTPFHFQLVQKVFESIRKVGASGAHLSRGERSMLDAFQGAALRFADREVGLLVPMYAFYPSIESFLDTAVKATIDRAAQNTGLEQPLDLYLLQTLFLIRYVGLIKPTVDNLVTLFVDSLDEDRLALKDSLQKSLQRLERETLINRNGDLYYFLTDEERDISTEIKRVGVSTSEVRLALQNILFGEILKNQNKFRMAEYRRDYEYSRTLDEGLYGARAEQEIVLDVYTQFWEGYASLNETYCIAKSVEKPGHIICWLDSDQALEREVQLLCKTDKYISGPNRGETASQKRILRDRQAENAERRKNIGEMLKKLFCEAKFFSTGAHVSVPGADKGRPSAVQDYILADMVRNLYNKFAFLKSLQPSDEACRKKVRNLLESGLAGGDTDSDNAQALKEMEQYLQLQNMACVTVQDLQDRFGKRPYGWPEWEIILLSVRLVRAAKVQILGGGAADIDNTTLADQLLKVQGWKSLLVRLRRKLPDATVRRARIIYQNLTGRLAGEKAEDVVQVLRDLLKTWSTPLARYENLLSGGNYPGGNILSDCRELFTRLLGIRDDATFLENIVSSETGLEDARDGMDRLRDFFDNQRKVWDRLVRALAKFEPRSLSLCRDKSAAQALEALREIRSLESPFGQIMDIDGYVDVLERVAAKQLDAARKEALEDIDTSLDAFRARLAAIQASSDGSNAVLHPLQTLRKKIEQSSSPEDIAYLMSAFRAVCEDAEERLQAQMPREILKKLAFVFEELTGAPHMEQNRLVRDMRDYLAEQNKTCQSMAPVFALGVYPGKSMLCACQGLLSHLIAIREDSVFARTAVEVERENLLRFGKDMATLTTFLETQKAVWDRLVEGLQRFAPNRASLGRDREAARALRELESIRSMPAPWKRIEEIPGLLETLDRVSQRQLSEAKTQALGDIAKRRDALCKVLSALPAQLLQEERKKELLAPLEEIVRAVEAAATPQDVAYATKDVAQVARDMRKLVEKTVQELMPRTEIVVNLQDLAGERTLENADDVRKLCGELQRELVSRLQAGKGQIRIMLR